MFIDNFVHFYDDLKKFLDSDLLFTKNLRLLLT